MRCCGRVYDQFVEPLSLKREYCLFGGAFARSYLLAQGDDVFALRHARGTERSLSSQLGGAFPR